MIILKTSTPAVPLSILLQSKGMVDRTFLESKSLVLTEEVSFEAVLDATFERLWETQVQYSIRRIKEMDEGLIELETELNEFLSHVNGSHVNGSHSIK